MRKNAALNLLCAHARPLRTPGTQLTGRAARQNGEQQCECVCVCSHSSIPMLVCWLGVWSARERSVIGPAPGGELERENTSTHTARARTTGLRRASRAIIHTLKLLRDWFVRANQLGSNRGTVHRAENQRYECEAFANARTINQGGRHDPVHGPVIAIRLVSGR